MKSRGLNLFLAVSIILSVGLALSAETTLNVPNAPPRFLGNIPNITILANAGSQFGFDLDDYLIDDNGDNLTINYTSLSNISVSLNSENEFYFDPDIGFQGSEPMQITATDGEFDTTSNIFFIIVGDDTEPPQWSNPSKNRATVYQNYNVQFSTLWTDNFALASYIFSIDQGGGFVNQTSSPLTGTSNQSSTTFQISAGAGTTIRWRFYATDENGNTNVTDIQSFVVATPSTTGQPSDSESGGGGGSGGSGTAGSGSQVQDGEVGTGGTIRGFSADLENFKITLRQGDTATKIVRISSTATIDQTISTYLTDLGTLASLDLDFFEIAPGETEDLVISFKIPRRAAVGQYFGTLTISNGNGRLNIPIIVEVKEFDAAVDLNVSINEEYKRVKAGEPVRALITIESLKDIRATSSELIISLKDYRGAIIETSSERFEFTATFSEERELIVPEGTPDGEYIFYARIVSPEFRDIGSDDFFIGSRYTLSDFIFPLIYLLIIILIIILFIIYRRNKRKRELLELYLLINELKYFVKKGETDEALEIYKRIKIIYGQKIPTGFKEDKEKLKLELAKFSKVLREQKAVAPKKAVVNSATPTKQQPTSKALENTSIPAKKVANPTKKEPAAQTKPKDGKKETPKEIKNSPVASQKPGDSKASLTGPKKQTPIKREVPKVNTPAKKNIDQKTNTINSKTNIIENKKMSSDKEIPPIQTTMVKAPTNESSTKEIVKDQNPIMNKNQEISKEPIKIPINNPQEKAEEKKEATTK